MNIYFLSQASDTVNIPTSAASFSLIIAIIAIISPLLTALINVIHATYIKNKEYNRESKQSEHLLLQKTYSEYINAVSQIITRVEFKSSLPGEVHIDYQRCFLNTLLISSKVISISLLSIDNLIKEKKYSEIIEPVKEVTMLFSDHLKNT